MGVGGTTYFLGHGLRFDLCRCLDNDCIGEYLGLAVRLIIKRSVGVGQTYGDFQERPSEDNKSKRPTNRVSFPSDACGVKVKDLDDINCIYCNCLSRQDKIVNKGLIRGSYDAASV